MEPLNSDTSNVKPRSVTPVDRVTIGRLESEKLNAWIDQVQSSSKGFLLLTKSDLVNFIIREHKAEMASKEISQLRADHYDPIKHINWITQELKTALAKNDSTMVSVLQNEIKGIELSVVGNTKDVAESGANVGSAREAPPKIKRKRTPKPDATPPHESVSIADLQDKLPEG